MKFPRNARIFRGQLDAAPFLSVFFLLVIFLMLGSLAYTPGVRIQLPPADKEPSVATGPTVSVAVDASGQFYFKNDRVNEAELIRGLHDAAKKCPEPLTLIVQADKETKRESLDQLAGIARQAGIREMLLATLPRLGEAQTP